MNQELVSIIMPTYNSSKHVAKSIDSILNQTYRNWELIITDDCSTDDTIKILNSYSNKDNRIKVYKFEVKKGAGHSRNHSIEKSQGRYLAFCDSDDCWMPEKLEKQIKLMQDKKCCLSFTSYFERDEDDNETGIIIAPKQITLSELKKDNKIGCLTAIYDTSMYGKFYMPTIRKRQDWALFLTILKKCNIAYAIQEPLAYYRLCENSISTNKFSLIRYNIKVYKKVFGYSEIKANLYFYFVFMPNYLHKVIRNKFIYILYKTKFISKKQ